MTTNENLHLSPHFTLAEFLRSKTASKLHIKNTPSENDINNMRFVAQQLEKARLVFGPIHINSGYRSIQLNHAVHGVGNSAHLYGLAADIVPITASIIDMFKWMKKNLAYDQLLLEHRHGTWWIHFAVKRDPTLNRHMAIENYPAGKTLPSRETLPSPPYREGAQSCNVS